MNETPARLSLFDIEAAWMDLIQAREEAESIGDQKEREEALTAVDNAIAEYVAREVQKVDGIRAVVRRLKIEAADAKAEAERQRVRHKRAEDILERVKHCVQTAMEMVGKKRIEGRTGYLLLKGNGGVEPLVIDGWDSEKQKWTGETVLPYEYQTITVKMPRNLWSNLISEYNDGTMQAGVTEPNNQLIRVALSHDCQRCFDYAPSVCESCGGTGKRGVPGAHLEPRGVHVECK